MPKSVMRQQRKGFACLKNAMWLPQRGFACPENDHVAAAMHFYRSEKRPVADENRPDASGFPGVG